VSPASDRPSALRRRRRADYLVFGGVWLLLLVYPFIAPNNYLIGLGALFCINVILIGSLNLLMGVSGQISLSHGAFYGLGAYASGVLGAKFGIDPWIGLAAACALAGTAALIIGLPALRLHGHYLAMATLGFNAIMTVLFYELVPLTGGADGLVNIPSISIFGLRLGTDFRFSFLAWAIAGLLLLAMLNLIHSRVGRGLRALADGELAANSMGVDTYRYKLAVFVLTAMMAAIAGALYGNFTNFVSPDSFSFFTSVLMVVMVAVGGAGRFWGGIIGALIYTALPELLRSLEHLAAALSIRIDVSASEILFFGISMILVLLFFPRGLAGGLEQLLRGSRRR